jgi:signal transduction histidine kinase
VPEVEELTAAIGATLRDAIALAEREILAAGQNMASMLADCQGQMTDLDLLSREFVEGSPSQDGLGPLAERLLDTLAETPRLFESVGLEAGRISQIAGEAHRDTREILELAAAIGKISNRSKLLALNTRIEASRKESNKEVLAVLAHEMRALSDEILGATAEMEQLGQTLTTSLPSVSSGAAAVALSCGAHTGSLTGTVAPFRTAYQRARQSVETALANTKTRAERIRQEYTAILQHLQFQDRVAQQLGTAQEKVDFLALTLREVIALAENDPHDPDLATAILQLCEKRMAAAPRPAAPSSRPLDDGTAGEIKFL